MTKTDYTAIVAIIGKTRERLASDFNKGYRVDMQMVDITLSQFAAEFAEAEEHENPNFSAETFGLAVDWALANN